MCGIVGYVGNKMASQVLINALKKLFQLSADADKWAKDWMDSHPIRDRWQPGGKLDSPWN